LNKENKKKRKRSLPEDLPEATEEKEVVSNKRKLSRKRISQDKSSKKGLKHNILKYIILAILGLGIVYFVVSLFVPEEMRYTTGKTVKQIELGNAESYDIEAFGKNVVVCNQSGVTAFDKNGKEKWKVDSPLFNPFAEAYGDNMIVTDSAKNSAMLIGKNGKIKANMQFDGSCVAASVNKNGWVVAILTHKGYKGRVEVFDSKGKLRYSWDSANNDIIAAELAGDNKTLAVVLLDSSSSASANGIISLYDITTESKPFSGITTDNNIVTYVRWSGKNLVCVGSQETFKINKSGKKLWSYQYPGEMLMYNAEKDSVFAFAIASNSTASAKVTTVYTINDDGKELGHIDILGDIKNISVKGSDISAVTSDKIVTLKKNASIKSECSLNRDISNGYILDGGSNYLVITGSSAEFLSLSKR